MYAARGQSDGPSLRRIKKLRSSLREQRKLQSALRTAENYRSEVWERHQQLQATNEELAQTCNRYVELFDFAPIGYLIFDENGVVLDVNLTGAMLCGADRKNLIGLPFATFIAPGFRQTFFDHMSGAREKSSARSELELKPREGPSLPIQLETRASGRGENGAACTFLTAMIDLSQLRHSEAERARLIEQRQCAESANRAKDRFLAMLSHELRTPLTPVLAAVSLPQKAEMAPAQLDALMEMIRRNIEIEARLIEDLLDVSRIDNGKLHLHKQPLDLHQLIEDVLAAQREEIEQRQLELTSDLRAAQHWVEADEVRIRQVLVNLLKNATEFTPPGGRILIRALNLRPEHITISVRNTGVGLEPEAIPRLFLPFSQAQEHPPDRGGLGLGLTISRGLVDAHGGQITAHSEGLGMGATFEVTLPTTSEPSGDAPTLDQSAKPAAQKPTRAQKIMLVEDHLDTAETMSRLLTKSGYEVRVAGTLREALWLAREENSFDVVVSDLGLPDGSGLDLMRQIHTDHLPAIALSGYATEEDRRRSLEAGFTEHLAKPVDLKKLLSTIAALTEKRSQ